MIEIILISGSAFVLSVMIGKPTINNLIKFNILKNISQEIVGHHHLKSGTPTMGGIQIFLTVLIITGIFNLENRLSILLPFTAILIALIIGIIDDFQTTVSNHRIGLSWKIKMTCILILALCISVTLFYQLDVQSINLPLLGKKMLNFYYIPIAIIVIFLTTSSVAITDGLDGLLAGTSAISFTAFAAIAFMQGQEYIATFSFTMAGSILGFLWYNAFPAKVFMGEAGALPIGISLSIVALMTGHWFLLPVIGIVFVLEASSAIIQIIYFKLTNGKRIFKMTPLHHHFEMIGWSETQIVIRFWLISFGGAMIGIALAISI
jgi:phospho-N-acetylmuramoyl-pentapeptide-transferase